MRVVDREELIQIINRINSGDNSILLQDLDVSNIVNMNRIFYDIHHIDWDIHDISGWCVSNVTDMGGMFLRSNFNRFIGDWDTSNVRYMHNMFHSTPFNQDISKWNMSSVEIMAGMFQSSEFNQDISGWDVSNVKYMNHFIAHNSSFIHDLSKWRDRLRSDLLLAKFNTDSTHKKIYGVINSYSDFLNIKSLDEIVEEKLYRIKKTNDDKERYETMKKWKYIIEITGYRIGDKDHTIIQERQ